MKIEFEARDAFSQQGEALIEDAEAKAKMESFLRIFGQILLVGVDETIYNVKIDGKEVGIY